jgi:hypothetical protein
MGFAEFVTGALPVQRGAALPEGTPLLIPSETDKLLVRPDSAQNAGSGSEPCYFNPSKS